MADNQPTDQKDEKDTAVLLAFGVTLLAGLCTCVGGVLGVHRGFRSRGLLATALAFAAGVMLTVSVGEILPTALATLRESMSNRDALALAGTAAMAGVVLVVAIDGLLPHPVNPADLAGAEKRLDAADLRQTRRLLRSGFVVVALVAAHNLPEGMATFLATLADPVGGLTLAGAIAIHNVPEGIAVAAPVYAATGSRARAVGWAAVSGLTEPIGGLLGLVLLRVIVPDGMFELILCFVAGLMIAVSLRELIPTSHRYRTASLQLPLGLMLGVAVMALSFVLLA